MSSINYDENLDVPTPVLVSGETVYTAPPTGGKSRPLLSVTGASGGVILTSGAVTAMTIKNLTGNTDMFVGFSEAAEMPYSGFGFLLGGGEAWSFSINELGRVRAFATTSGQLITYGGVSK